MGNYVSKSTGYDPYDGKKKVTPELIYDSLAAQKKGGLIVGLVCSFLLLLVAGLFIFILSVESRLTEQWNKIVKMLLLAVPLFTVFGVVLSYWRGLKRLTRDSYIVITDTIDRVVEDDQLVGRHSPSRTTYHMEHAMYLSRCGRVVISLSETNTNSAGDVVYAVVDKKHPTRPLLLYNAKYYELEDPDKT